MSRLIFTPECSDLDAGGDRPGRAERIRRRARWGPFRTRTTIIPTITWVAPAPPDMRGRRAASSLSAWPGRSAPGKTALVETLCRALWPEINLAVITNDIYTHEDAEFLSRREALPLERIVGVQTGGCPHTAIRDDASANLSAVANFQRQFPGLELVVIESGGDNLTAVFSRELADRFIFVIDVAEGDKIPRKGGPGICNSDLLVINKTDLAPHVGCRPRRHAPRQPEDAGRAAVPDGQPPPEGRRRGGDHVGSRATRITREDLLTPPEFSGLHLVRTPGRPDRRGADRADAVRRRDPAGDLLPAGPGPPDAAVRSRPASRRRCCT